MSANRVTIEENFYTLMSRVTSIHFAKYFCDIYSKSIAPCAVMTYATSDAIWVTALRLCTLRSRSTVWFD
jgi:hypothetical protein